MCVCACARMYANIERGSEEHRMCISKKLAQQKDDYRSAGFNTFLIVCFGNFERTGFGHDNFIL